MLGSPVRLLLSQVVKKKLWSRWLGWSPSVLNVVVGSERLMMMTVLMTQALRVQVTMAVQTVTMLVQCIRQEVIHATIWTIYVI